MRKQKRLEDLNGTLFWGTWLFIVLFAFVTGCGGHWNFKYSSSKNVPKKITEVDYEWLADNLKWLNDNPQMDAVADEFQDHAPSGIKTKILKVKLPVNTSVDEYYYVGESNYQIGAYFAWLVSSPEPGRFSYEPLEYTYLSRTKIAFKVPSDMFCKHIFVLVRVDDIKKFPIKDNSIFKSWQTESVSDFNQRASEFENDSE